MSFHTRQKETITTNTAITTATTTVVIYTNTRKFRDTPVGNHGSNCYEVRLKSTLKPSRLNK